MAKKQQLLDLSTDPQNIEYINSSQSGINPIGYSESRDRKKIGRLIKKKWKTKVIRRFKWKNLPPELSAELIERILYYRGMGCFFKGIEGKYYFLPYSLLGTINVYGEYITVTPQVFTGTQDKEEAFIPGLALKVIYEKGAEGDCVILRDSSLNITQYVEPLATSFAPIFEQQTNIWILASLDLIGSANIDKVKTADENQKKAVEQEFANLDNKILNGSRVIAVADISDKIENFGNQGSEIKSEKLFNVYQTIENLGEGFIGIKNKGLQHKNSIELRNEQELNEDDADEIYDDAYEVRKKFCELVNAKFGLTIDIEKKENKSSVIKADESINDKENEGEII